MPFASLQSSPFHPGKDGIHLYYREYGKGIPLLILHGGWGYHAYPFDRQIESLAGRYRVLVPDRSGYGRSGRLSEMPIDFHRRAAGEMIRLLDVLKIDRLALWGHSDGAVIAAWMGLEDPSRFTGMILEAIHYYRVKPSSRSFFEDTARDPLNLKPELCEILEQDHGEDYWQDLIRNNCRVWVRLSDEATNQDADLFGGKLSQLAIPAIFLHGMEDPRTEPDELKRVQTQLPKSKLHVIPGARHSPHSEEQSSGICNSIAYEFLNSL